MCTSCQVKSYLSMLLHPALSFFCCFNFSPPAILPTGTSIISMSLHDPCLRSCSSTTPSQTTPPFPCAVQSATLSLHRPRRSGCASRESPSDFKTSLDAVCRDRRRKHRSSCKPSSGGVSALLRILRRSHDCSCYAACVHLRAVWRFVNVLRRFIPHHPLI